MVWCGVLQCVVFSISLLHMHYTPSPPWQQSPSSNPLIHCRKADCTYHLVLTRRLRVPRSEHSSPSYWDQSHRSEYYHVSVCLSDCLLVCLSVVLYAFLTIIFSFSCCLSLSLFNSWCPFLHLLPFSHSLLSFPSLSHFSSLLLFPFSYYRITDESVFKRDPQNGSWTIHSSPHSTQKH